MSNDLFVVYVCAYCLLARNRESMEESQRKRTNEKNVQNVKLENEYVTENIAAISIYERK